MDIRQLKAFIAVFEERNITTAAQRLSLSQPTLSVTIRNLEDELGTTLFLRQARGVEVSEHARLLYPQARQMVASADGLKRMFLHSEQRPAVTLGVEDDIGHAHLEAFLRAASRALPVLALTLEHGCAGDARLAVEESRCEDELFLPLWDDPFVLALPAGTGADTDGDAEATGWIVCPQHASHQRLASSYGSAPEAVAAQAGSLKQALSLVAAGFGRALLPRSLVAEHGGVRAGACAFPLPTRRVGFCYAANALESHALRVLHNHLQHAGT